MAESCKKQQVRVEEEQLEPIDRFVKELREQCEKDECNPWVLCLNKIVCWSVWVSVKVTEWVVVIIVRWVYRIVCVAVSLVVGLFALIFTFNPDVLIRAVQDLLELARDAVFLGIGALLLYLNFIIDAILTALKRKDEPRQLTKAEIAILRPIFGDSLPYSLIKVNEGRLGIMGPPYSPVAGGATTMGYTIYFRSPVNYVTLVHECVHVWQFQFGGPFYIGQSALFQPLHWLGASDPYDWFSQIGSDRNGWYLMESMEAQAEFIEDVFNYGRYVSRRGVFASDGDFFRLDDDGNNEFTYGLDAAGNEITDPGLGALDFTEAANAAWAILRME